MSDDERHLWEEHLARLLREREEARTEAARLRELADSLIRERDRAEATRAEAEIEARAWQTRAVSAEARATAQTARLEDLAATMRVRR